MKLLRVLAVFTTVGIAATYTASSAVADKDGPLRGASGDRSVSVGSDGRAGGGGGSGPSSSGSGRSSSGTGGRTKSTTARPVCYSERARSVDVRVGPLEWKPASSENMLFPFPSGPDEIWQITHCLHSDGRRTNSVTLVNTAEVPGAPASAPIPALTPAQLALRATANLHFDFPALGTSPVGGRHTVGFPTWIWVDPASWQPRYATDTDSGLTVNLTATPATITFDPGDRTPAIDCHGPGTPYRPGAGWAASPTCGHTYTAPSSRHPGGRTDTATTLIWKFTWTATDGTSGTLPELQLVHRQPFTVTAYTTTTN